MQPLKPLASASSRVSRGSTRLVVGRPTNMVGSTKRICGKCRKILPLPEFSTWVDNRYTLSGVGNKRYSSYCRKCKKEYVTNYQKNSPKAKAYRAQHSKTSNAYVKARCERDPEYAAKIRERNRATARARYKRIMERVKTDPEYAAKYHARRRKEQKNYYAKKKAKEGES